MIKFKWFIYRIKAKLFKNKYVICIDYSNGVDFQCEGYAVLKNGEIHYKDFKITKGSKEDEL